MGGPVRKPDKSSNSGPGDRRGVPPPAKSSPAVSKPASGWTRQDRFVGTAVGLLALVMVGLAIWQAMPKPVIVQSPPARLVAEKAAMQPVDAASAAPSAPRDATEAGPVEPVKPPRTASPPVENKVVTAKAADDSAGTGESPALTADQPASKASSESSVPDAEDARSSPPPGTPSTPKDSVAAAKSAEDGRTESVAVDESDDYENTGAEDFACPVPWLRESKMTERVKYLNALQAILKAGWDDKPGALKTARAHFETAKRLCGDDPRLDYSFGLVLWNLGQHSEARQEWEAATRTGPQPFLPALSALIWAKLLDHDEAAGFASIERVAEALVQSRSDYPTPAQRSHAVLFLGRAIGFLKGPGKSPEVFDQVLKTEQNLRDALPDDLEKVFENGQAQAARRFEQFQRRAERPEADVVTEFEVEKHRLANELSSLRSELKQLDELRRVLPRDAKSSLAELVKESSELEGKISDLSTGIAQGESMAAELAQPRAVFIGFRTFTDQIFIPGNGKTGKDRIEDRVETRIRQEPQYRAETQQEVDARLKNRKDVVAKIDGLSAELREAEERHREIPQERTDVTKAFRVQKLEKARAAAAARRKIAELLALDRDLRKDFATPDELRERMTSLAPYVPWTPESDRDGLVASYRQPSAKAPLPKAPSAKVAAPKRDRQKSSL